MNDRNRFKRPRPARPGPDRNPIHNVRGPDASARDPRQRERPVARGVDAGYQVIDEHIRRGQEAAYQARRTRPRQSQSKYAPFREEMGRSGLGDLFWMWVEFMQRFPLGNFGPFGRGPARARAHAHAQGGWAPFFEDEQGAATPDEEWEEQWDSRDEGAEDEPALPDMPDVRDEDDDDDSAWDPPSEAQPFREEQKSHRPKETRSAPRMQASMDIASKRPVQVTLDVAPEACNRTLAIHGLNAIGPDARPLAGVEIETRGNIVVLRVRIADEQQAGPYAGIILDRASNEPLGTLSLVIAEA